MMRGRAVGRVAFLVAGDKERYRPVAPLDARDCRDEGGDGALHVDCAAAAEDAVLDDRLERIGAPPVAGGHHVQMSGESEMRSAFTPNRDHVLGWAVGRLAEDEAMNGETEGLQRRLQHVEHLAAGGSHARAVDQLLRKRDGVD